MVIAPDRTSNSKSVQRLERGGFFLVPFLFAAVFTLVPWPQLWEHVTGGPMWDRQVYIRTVEENSLFFDRLEYSEPLDYVSYEYLWGWLLRTCADWGIATGHVLNSIGFFYILFSSIIVYRNLPLPFLFLLINPVVIGLAFSQSRTALMISVLYLAFFVKNKSKILALFLACIAPAIHTSAPLFILLYFLSVCFLERNLQTRSPFWPVGAGLLVGALSGPLMSEVLAFLEDRRAERTEDMSASLPFLSIWIIGMLYLLWIWPAIRSNAYANIGLALTVFAASSLLLDSYASRFIAALFPIGIVALSSFYIVNKQIDIMIFLFFSYIIVWSGSFFVLSSL